VKRTHRHIAYEAGDKSKSNDSMKPITYAPHREEITLPLEA